MHLANDTVTKKKKERNKDYLKNSLIFTNLTIWISNNSSVMLMLLAQAPHLENFWSKLLCTTWQCQTVREWGPGTTAVWEPVCTGVPAATKPHEGEQFHEAGAPRLGLAPLQGHRPGRQGEGQAQATTKAKELGQGNPLSEPPCPLRKPPL